MKKKAKLKQQIQLEKAFNEQTLKNERIWENYFENDSIKFMFFTFESVWAFSISITHIFMNINSNIILTITILSLHACEYHVARLDSCFHVT